MGIFAAVKRDRAIDHGTSVIALLVAALPEFVIAVALILLFATNVFHLLPPVSYIAPGEHPWSHALSMVLPALTLTIAIFPYIFRMMRSSMVEALQSDYIEMARLNGVRSRILVLRHALPNALAPTIQVIALTFAYLAGGVVIVEFVFGYPGIGEGLVNAVNLRDIPVIQLIVLLLAAFYVGLNVFADALAILVTPRLRTGMGRVQ
jgi:peptide/nickel transport system permease protein